MNKLEYKAWLQWLRDRVADIQEEFCLENGEDPRLGPIVQVFRTQQANARARAMQSEKNNHDSRNQVGDQS